MTNETHTAGPPSDEDLAQLRAQVFAQADRRKRKLAAHKQTTQRTVVSIDRATTFMSKSKLERYIEEVDNGDEGAGE